MGAAGSILYDTVFSLVAGLVSHCDEKVVYRVGYVLGVGVCLAFVREHGG